MEQALLAYTDFVKETQNVATCENKVDLAHAYKFLANQHLKNNNLDLAHQYAQKCLMFEEVRNVIFNSRCREYPNSLRPNTNNLLPLFYSFWY